jgi:hypothetical protein
MKPKNLIKIPRLSSIHPVGWHHGISKSNLARSFFPNPILKQNIVQANPPTDKRQECSESLQTRWGSSFLHKCHQSWH